MKTIVALVACLFAFSVNAEEMTVVVSIPPQKYLVDKISGRSVKVLVMADKGSDPHTFAPKASMAAAFTRSKLYLGIGFPFEKSMVIPFAQNSKLPFVSTETGIPLAEEEAASLTGEKEHDGHDHLDPHVWTSPRTMLIIAENTYNALIEANPSDKTLYEAGFAALAAEIRSVNAKFEELFKNESTPKAFLIYHPSLGYFARDYGLTQYTVEVDGKAPKARDLANVISNADSLGLKVLITQPQQSDEAANALAKELGIKTVRLDILTEDWAAFMQNLYSAFADTSK